MSIGRVALMEIDLTLLPLQRDPDGDDCKVESFIVRVATTGRADVFDDGIIHRVEIYIGDAVMWVPVSTLSRGGEPYVPELNDLLKTIPLGVLEVVGGERRSP